MPFITTIDTVLEGRVAAWRDQDGRPVIYEDRLEAEMEAAEGIIHEDDVPDDVIEVVVTEDTIIDPIDGRVYWTKGEAQ